MEDTQLMKGILEGCILAVISRGETYGYEILSELMDYGFTNLQEGTLYPILTRLEKKKYISCRKAKSPHGWTEVKKDGKWYVCDPDMELNKVSSYMKETTPCKTSVTRRCKMTALNGKVSWK